MLAWVLVCGCIRLLRMEEGCPIVPRWAPERPESVQNGAKEAAKMVPGGSWDHPTVVLGPSGAQFGNEKNGGFGELFF